jgi:hypothetical protein
MGLRRPKKTRTPWDTPHALLYRDGVDFIFCLGWVAARARALRITRAVSVTGGLFTRDSDFHVEEPGLRHIRFVGLNKIGDRKGEVAPLFHFRLVRKCGGVSWTDEAVAGCSNWDFPLYMAACHRNSTGYTVGAHIYTDLQNLKRLHQATDHFKFHLNRSQKTCRSRRRSHRRSDSYHFTINHKRWPSLHP